MMEGQARKVEAFPPGERLARVKWYHVHFRVSCDTAWGENLVLLGAGEHLGHFEHEAGLWMGCQKEAALWSLDKAKSKRGEGEGERQEELVWRARVSIPVATDVEAAGNQDDKEHKDLPSAKSKSSCYTVGPYRYAVVNQKVERVRGEPSWVERRFEIPLDLKDGSVVFVQDTWQDPSGPQVLLRSAMFTRVVFRPELHELGNLQARGRERFPEMCEGEKE